MQKINLIQVANKIPTETQYNGSGLSYHYFDSSNKSVCAIPVDMLLDAHAAKMLPPEEFKEALRKIGATRQQISVLCQELKQQPGGFYELPMIGHERIAKAYADAQEESKTAGIEFASLARQKLTGLRTRVALQWCRDICLDVELDREAMDALVACEDGYSEVLREERCRIKRESITIGTTNKPSPEQLPGSEENGQKQDAGKEGAENATS